MAAEATTTFPDTALFAHPAGPVKVAGPATTWLASRERGPPSYSLIGRGFEVAVGTEPDMANVGGTFHPGQIVPVSGIYRCTTDTHHAF